MFGVDGLNLARMVAESGIIDTAVDDIINHSKVLILAENRALNASVKKQIAKWRYGAGHRATRACDTEDFQKELNIYQEVIHFDKETFAERIHEVVEQLEPYSPFYAKACDLLKRNQDIDSPMFPHYFCEQWYESLSNAIRETGLAQVESDKESFLAELYQRIETMRQMDKLTESGEPGKLGRLWDMAGAKLSRKDVTLLKRYAEFLRKNRELQAIAEKLGRMAGEVSDPDLRKTPAEELKIVEEKSDEATDDIVGVHENNDLNKLLPNETMFLAEPELEVVFYKRLIDKRLMNYKVQGKSRTIRKVRAQKPEANIADIEKGPFIICVDASGSMSGFPEQSAKAMAYALMQIALAEERDCYVILFSTEQITYELTKQDGLREASDFLSYQFRGGTDLEPVLIKSVELMSSGRYRNADMVVISDFIAPKQSDEIQQMVSSLQADRNRFHAISLSKYGNPNLMGMFDHCWEYYPNLMDRFLKKW